MKFTIEGVDEVTRSLNGVGNALTDALKDGIGRACILLTAGVKDRLSDQVLRVRTGRLRRSVTYRVEGDQQVVGTVGTKVEYAGAHEFGFNGVVTVRAFTRRVVSRNAGYYRVGKSSGKRTGLERVTTATGVAFVHSFSRHMNIPERSFLRSTLNEMEPEVRAEIQDAVSKLMDRGLH